MYLTTQSDNGSLTLFSWLATAALYPLSTLKVRSQLMGTEFSVGRNSNYSIRSGLYRGVLPFLLLNGFLGWTLRPLFSQERLEEVKANVQEQKWETIRKH